MTAEKPLKLGIVAGEQSGENLAVDLVDAIARLHGAAPDLVGVGGDALSERGLVSIFDASEIALTGLTSVVASLPRLIRRIGQTADALIAAKPDAIVFIDSPDFSHRVARRVKRALPATPIFKYVAPSVWAWRPERAAKMAAQIDQIFAILPFEPDVMRELGGPVTHYVGHPLAVDKDMTKLWNARKKKKKQREQGQPFELLVLPGSRNGEIGALLPDFREAVHILFERGRTFKVTIPTLPRLEARIRRETADWRVTPTITTSREDKIAAFRKADAALAASGTVFLELAMSGVPAISCYRIDPLMKPFFGLITVWSAALPNIISDKPIVPEYIGNMIRPGMLARRIEELVEPGSVAAALQMRGFDEVRRLMAVEVDPGAKAAGILLDVIGARP